MDTARAGGSMPRHRVRYSSACLDIHRDMRDILRIASGRHSRDYFHLNSVASLRTTSFLITYQAHLATAGRRKLGFRRPRNHVSGRLAVDSRSPTSSRGRLRFVSAAQMSLVRNQDFFCPDALRQEQARLEYLEFGDSMGAAILIDFARQTATIAVTSGALRSFYHRKSRKEIAAVQFSRQKMSQQ